MASNRFGGAVSATWRGSRFTRVIVAVVLVAMIFGACTSPNGDDSDADGPDAGGQSGDDAETLDVVVSMPFMTSMVEAVGGEGVQVESIVPMGVDAHTYQPTPGDAQLIAEADLIMINGFGLEAFLDGLIESAGGVDAPVVELADGLQDEAIQSGGHHHDEDGQEDGDHDEDEPHEDDDDHNDDGEGHDHDGESDNPHFWLNPVYGIHYVENITAALVDIQPDNEAEYRENADGFIAEIEEFDRWAQEQIAGIPEENRVMVTFHDAYPYFAEHFGLEIVGVVITSPGREPGAQEIARLAEEISAVGVPAVFVEPQFNPELAETIADEAGVTTSEIYSDSAPEGVGYLEMMRMNVERVVEGLS